MFLCILLILLSSFRLNAKNLKLIFQLMKNNVKISLKTFIIILIFLIIKKNRKGKRIEEFLINNNINKKNTMIRKNIFL